MADASVIVPARDAQATLPRTLAALEAQDFEGRYEVIVVDDGSSDGTAALANAHGATVVQQPPLGPAAARNLGAARASAELIAFCDADVFPTAGWLRNGVAALGRADLVQGKVLPDHLVELGPYDRTIWVTSAAGLWETANLFVTRAVFDRVGGFEQWLAPRRGKALAEDVWFGQRAVRSGAIAVFCAEALAYHAVFERTWRAYVRERERVQYFPAMAAKMPELRRMFLYRRLFLNRRAATFDLALAGVLGALIVQRPYPLMAGLPYVKMARRRRDTMAADLCADAVGLIALLSGSARYRSAVL
jgi:glycosyltransferase involved in cell wall biosynthesis